MQEFEFTCRPRVLCGAGVFQRLGEFARELNFHRTLVVADPGIVAAGYAGKAIDLLSSHGISAELFSGFGENPDSAMVEAGRAAAETHAADSLIGLGGGSSLDCAKGISFVLTNGGTMRNYWGYGKARKPLLPMIGVPTTTGTGSEAQTYALISDAETHTKMACGNPDAYFRIALLDPEVAVSQPARVLALAGYDAISHAVETWVTAKRNPLSEAMSLQAWALLEPAFLKATGGARDSATIADLQLGAFLAGLAIENSMLGAAHACANPLTARYQTPHGAAIALMLPHVVRWNSVELGDRYRRFHPDLPARLHELAAAANLPRRLRDAGAVEADFDILAKEAAKQWTGRFNPRPFSEEAARDLYQSAW